MKILRALVFVLLAACVSPTQVIWHAFGVERFDPPPRFRVEYESVGICTGLTGNYPRVRWFLADSLWHEDYGFRVGGLWVYPHDIYLPRLAYAWETVRHEAIHDHLQRGGHPPEYFGKPGVPDGCEVVGLA